MRSKGRGLVRAVVTVTLVGASGVACGALAPFKPPTIATECLDGMARVDAPTKGKSVFCIDRFEAGLVEIGAARERAFSPYEQVKGRTVKAILKEGVVPQAYVSRDEADAACKRGDKRLCTESEWVQACMGAERTKFPTERSANQARATTMAGRRCPGITRAPALRRTPGKR